MAVVLSALELLSLTDYCTMENPSNSSQFIQNVGIFALVFCSLIFLIIVSFSRES